MNKHYRLFGAEMSPYSVKVRAYLRYKKLSHQWLVRNKDNQAEYDQHAKIAIVPLLVDEQGSSMQDSSPIIEALEASHGGQSIYPTEPGLNFIAHLLEEFADEWANKWMFHYRWARPLDQDACSKRLALMMNPSADEQGQAQLAESIAQRMISRVWFVGSSEQTAGQIEASFIEAIEQLDKHLASRPYLLGGRPSYADFGLWGQLYCCWTDPTAGTLIESRAQHVMAWIQRMLFPQDLGEFEPLASLVDTLQPFMASQLGQRYIPWAVANERAIGSADEQFTVQLKGQAWSQKPQKYHAKSLQILRDKYSASADRASIDQALAQCGCEADRWLAQG